VEWNHLPPYKNTLISVGHRHHAYDNNHINPLNTELNPVCHLLALLEAYLLALLEAYHILHIGRIRVKTKTDQHATHTLKSVPTLPR